MTRKDNEGNGDDCKFLLNHRYIGGENSAKNKPHLLKLGIKCIVNCTSHVPNFFPDEFVYLFPKFALSSSSLHFLLFPGHSCL